ncbi:MAG: four helix bundle protein [Candidatus Falkowbacteria bacterium]
MSNYILLKDLDVYKLALELSSIAWEVYSSLDWHDKKIMGDQFITATDSVGANIAEGYSRFHYLDKIKFYYISRASLSESCDHWLELLFLRQKVDQERFNKMKNLQKNISIKLNNFISSTRQSKYDG